MQNQDCKRFLGAISKIDETNIFFHYKLGGKFHDKHFYT